MSGETTEEADPPDRLLGTTLADRYRLESRIGEGGIGRVYRARHSSLGSHVAVKVLLDEYKDRPVLKKRFEREARALAELAHPNIVRVSDYGVHEGVLFIAMELLEGRDLADLLEDGPLEPTRAIDIIRQVLRALDYAHQRDVIHRDVKPHNVFVRPLDAKTDHVSVLDFGLARFVREASQGDTPLTRVGTVLGTPAYMAPEQATGGTADARADVYSVGVMFFELLASERPFVEDDTAELLRAHLLSDPPRLAAVAPELEVHRDLEAVIRRAMEKAPADRYTDAQAMLEAIDGLPAEALRPRRREAAAGDAAAAEAPERQRDIATAHTLAAAPTPSPTLPSGEAAAASPRSAPAASRQDASRPEVPRAFPLWLAGAALLAGIVLCGGGAFALFGGSDEDASGTGLTGAAGAEPAAPGAPLDRDDDRDVGRGALPEGVAPPERGPGARDPFVQALPPDLAPVHAKLQQGRHLSRSDLVTVRRYARAHPDDPRPYLIEAHHNVDIRSLSRAFPLYETALELDPSVRGDPEMLPDLLEMVRSQSVHRAAVELIVDVYGGSALPAVDAELEQRMRREEQRRLEALRDRLRA